jgi:hypothetical protein
MAKCSQCGGSVGRDDYLCPRCGKTEPRREASAMGFAGMGIALALIVFFFTVPFMLLRIGTSLPIWACTLISVPAGAVLSFLACKMADM